MATYSVFVPCTASICFLVEAESKDAAIQAALDSDFKVSVSGAAELHEFEVHEHICKGNIFYGVLNDIEVELIDG